MAKISEIDRQAVGRESWTSSMLSSMVATVFVLVLFMRVCNAIEAAPDAAGLEMVSFKVSEGTSYSVAHSPNGQHLAIDLQGRLWVLPLQGGDALPITDPLDEARLPAWSPDGKHLAFQMYTGGNFHIWTVRHDGAELRQLTFGIYDDRDPVWHPTTSEITFSSDRSGNFDIWSIDLASQDINQLTNDEQDEFNPAWSDDGSRLAYVTSIGDESGLTIREVGTANTSVVLQSRERIWHPNWHPEGDRLSYLSATPAKAYGNVTANLLDLESGKVTKLSGDGEDVFPGRVSWASDKKVIYSADGKIQTRSMSGKRLGTINFEAEFLVAAPHKFELKDHQFTSDQPRKVLGVVRPVVSPDGKSIVFTALGDIWLLEDDPRPQQLTNDSFVDADPAWSPDGRQIAFVSDRGGNNVKELFTLDLESKIVRRVTTGGGNKSGPSWSPDGSKIAVVTGDPRDWHISNLQLVDVATGEMTLTHSNEFTRGQASWSPDGKHVAMMVYRPKSDRFRMGANEILIHNVDDGTSYYTTPHPGQSLSHRLQKHPVWSPDGSKMAYVFDGLLWIVPVSPKGEILGPPQRITGESANSPSWTGDSMSLVYQSFDKLKRVYLEDGHTEEVALDLTWRRAIPKGRKVIHAGRLFDATGSEYQHDVDIVIDRNVITAIHPHIDSWDDDVEFIDASSQTVLPGLWEAHMHQGISGDSEVYGRDRLAYGITSVRNPGAYPYESLEKRESWESGRRIGPREFYSGILDGTRLYYSMVDPIVSPAQVEIELERMTRMDYDFVKTYERLPHQYQKRITQYAHENGLIVASHEIYPAAMYGVDVVDHLSSGDKMEYSDRMSLPRKVYNDAVGIMAHSGMMVVPTSIGAIRNLSEFPDPISLKQTQNLQRQANTFTNATKWAFKPKEAFTQNELSSINTLVENDIELASATDWGSYSKFTLNWETAFFAESRLGTAGALIAATLGGAKATGVADHLGTIEPGKLADIIIVDGDPLEKITDLYNIVYVIRDGRIYSLDELVAKEDQR